MAVPGRTGAYVAQSSTDVGEAIAYGLNDAQWTNNPTSFEVNRLPSGFTTDGQSLGGVAGCKMLYTLFIRGVNADGRSEWVPLLWTVPAVAEPSERTLIGVPMDWPATAQSLSGQAAVILVIGPGKGLATGPGLLYVNDGGVDGNATKYGPSFRGNQLILNGAADTFFRADAPGWEIIRDEN